MPKFACPAAFAIVSALSAPNVLAQLTLDWTAPPGETVINTDSTVLTATNGVPVPINGGLFVFRNVTIPAGSVVRGEGSLPMVWVVADEFRVEGELRVDGEDGMRVDTLNSANFPALGGRGACSGGDGGAGSPNAIGRSLRGETGFGPNNVPGLGGTGGALYCTPTLLLFRSAPGGGGGTFSLAGDPEFNLQNPNYTQWRGVGGISVPGTVSGQPGVPQLPDGLRFNDFIGMSVDVFNSVALIGELPRLQGGSGGGGGGDRALGSRFAVFRPRAQAAAAM